MGERLVVSVGPAGGEDRSAKGDSLTTITESFNKFKRVSSVVLLESLTGIIIWKR
jgi:hypothetical protein